MLISISGIDGAGKSTMAKKLAEVLGAQLLTFPDREAPGTGPWLVEYLQGGHTDATPNMVQAVYAANRSTKLLELWQAKGHKHTHVLCDRYLPDGRAYGCMDGCDDGYLESLEAGFPQPDLALLLNCHPSLASERLPLAGRERYEDQEKLYKAYNELRFVWSRHAGDTTWREVWTFEQALSAALEICGR